MSDRETNRDDGDDFDHIEVLERAIRESEESRFILADQIGKRMIDADRAQPFLARTAAGYQEPTSYIRTPAVSTMTFNLREALLPSLAGADGRVRRTPDAELVGKTERMPGSLIANSRVASVGAHLFVASDNRKAIAGGVAMESRPEEFRTIEAVIFGVVDTEAGIVDPETGFTDAETEDAAPTAGLPVLAASMDFRQAITLGVNFEIPRSARKSKNPKDLHTEISIALALGIARAADAVLLSAIAATTPAAFSLAAAAARGLRVGELRGLVGTGADGASLAEDGSLRAASVPAELTPDMAGTLVGAWDRAGVAIYEDVTVHLSRLGNAGHLRCTALAEFLPLVPDPSAFWTVPA